jgi:hypothetical protein
MNKLEKKWRISDAEMKRFEKTWDSDFEDMMAGRNYKLQLCVQLWTIGWLGGFGCVRGFGGGMEGWKGYEIAEHLEPFFGHDTVKLSSLLRARMADEYGSENDETH